MQISRHWRLNAQRYRLEGTRTPTGQVRFQPRIVLDSAQGEVQPQAEVKQTVRTAVAAR